VLILAATVFVLAAVPPIGAAPVGPDTNLPSPARFVPAQLSGHVARTIAVSPDRTFERYGPQATERAVRSSLKVALVPDPLAMGALIFCAFALRWMRARREHSRAAGGAIATPARVLPRAA